jgi:sugar lactone lactonase YvrE
LSPCRIVHAILGFGFVTLSSSFAAAATSFALRPGHLYGCTGEGVVEYDADLNLIATLPMPPHATLLEGAAFTHRGTFVCSIVVEGDSRTQHVIEIDASGTVINDLDLGAGGGPNRAAHIDVDAAGRIYAAAGSRVAEVAPDFSSYRNLSFFTRASGVAVAQDDRVYATDQSANRLLVFNASRNLERTFDTGNVPVGIDFSPSGQLYLCEFLNDRLVIVDTSSGATTPVLTGLNEISDIEFSVDGSYYLSWNRGDYLEHRSADGTLLASATTSGVVDSIAFMVPEPTSSLLLATATLILLGHRSNTRCATRRAF